MKILNTFKILPAKPTLTTGIIFITLIFCILMQATYAAPCPALAQHQTQLGLYLAPAEAYALKQKTGDQSLFIDIRTPNEIEVIGQPQMIDANIPYEFYPADDEAPNGYITLKNQQFLAQISHLVATRHLHQQSPIMLICRSGIRTAKAADELAKSGFTQVYTVLDGYEGQKIINGPLHGQRLLNGWKNTHWP